MMSILLKNAQVITLNDDSDVYDKCCVGIKHKKIDYVGHYYPGIDDEYETVLDCTDKAVMPGFVNAHTHSAMTIFRNYADDMKLMDWLYKKIFPLEDKLDGDIVYWASSLAIVEMIKSGTTMFNDMYFFMDKTAEACIDSGIKAALARGLSGDVADNDDPKIKEAVELYKNYNNAGEGRIKVMLSPHAIYTCSLPYLKMVAEKSREFKIPIHTHVSETKSEVDGSIKKYGMSPVKLLDNIEMLKNDTVAAHCVVVDDDDLRILSQRGVNVAHNPESNMKLASGIAPVTKMTDMGINVCIGTDGASSNNNLDMVEELRMAAYLQKVHNEDPTALPVDEVLKMATINGAKALGFKDSGMIKEGMAADIIVINTDKPYYYPRYDIKSAIVYSGSSSDVETVIIDGSIVMKNNELVTMDEERIYSEVGRCVKKLIG